MKLGVRIDGGDAMASTFSRLGRTEGLAKVIETCAEDVRETAVAEFGSGMLGGKRDLDLTATRSVAQVGDGPKFSISVPLGSSEFQDQGDLSDGGQPWRAPALNAAQPRIDARLGDWLTRAVKAASGR